MVSIIPICTFGSRDFYDVVNPLGFKRTAVRPKSK